MTDTLVKSRPANALSPLQVRPDYGLLGVFGKIVGKDAGVTLKQAKAYYRQLEQPARDKELEDAILRDMNTF